MNTSTRNETNETPDRFETFLLWSAAAVLFSILVVMSVVSPLLYLWVFGITTCFAIGVGSVVLGGLIAGEGFFGVIFGIEIVKGAFQAIVAILQGLLSISK